MKKAILFKKEKNKKVRCLACCHKCLISDGNTGICGVRKNIKGKLFLLVYGKIASMNVDPIEKKPIYHFLPGSYAFSIGTIGCNFSCLWCQNSSISQASKGINREIFGEERKPEEIVSLAVKYACKSIAYTYNEPSIFAEYAYDTAVLAKQAGLKNVFVTNGYMSKEAFDYLNKKRLIDAMNIDLKSFSNKTYRKYCGARLKPVLDTIKRAHKAGIHIEITTLVVPGVNDSKAELEKIARFIAKIDKNIPWHISRFFPMYKMMKKEQTSLASLEKAEKIGIKAGLKFVHMGNV